ncbi:tRNA n6-adenosine threonylcarbamoyltransferase [Plakobranchus ocellatus]|uniref:N(6)-L-threonylcarbamoyladenine synthase n=1 Tax=Plakobranchus ocellatus TaxID=259542 RepID=A0AAV4AT58_9GAST|nr:tRNA n6-adenosine threonylcarbamoyltransferase [Plakobranchus ocellatus]
MSVLQFRCGSCSIVDDVTEKMTQCEYCSLVPLFGCGIQVRDENKKLDFVRHARYELHHNGSQSRKTSRLSLSTCRAEQYSTSAMAVSMCCTYSKLKFLSRHRFMSIPVRQIMKLKDIFNLGSAWRSVLITSEGNNRKRTVLGIETSCDDTGAAIVDSEGHILGEALHSQTSTHNLTGGIVPNVAKELHAKNVEMVVEQALDDAQMRLQDVDALAVTVKPGLIMSLRVGLRHAQKLCQSSGLPLIPIHHMEAHALTARMIDKIEFPFLVLLASGGHCLLAVAKGIDDFELLGSSLDTAPGEAFDKTARELNLFQLPRFEGLSGGVAVERLAREGNPHAYPRIHVMTSVANCNFSFTGLKISARRQILREYQRQGLATHELLPQAADICAWFQFNLLYHIARRLQRAFIFAEMHEICGDKKTLVVSGGVASNSYIRGKLSGLCETYGYRLVCPPAKLCTDNGIMIAWNGMEKLLNGRDFSQDPDGVDVQARSPFGINRSKEVSNSFIKLPRLVMDPL